MPDWDVGKISYDLPMFYSFNVGPVHFISLNTEYYYFLNFGATQLLRQYNWLVNDLEVFYVLYLSFYLPFSFQNTTIMVTFMVFKQNKVHLSL